MFYDLSSDMERRKYPCEAFGCGKQLSCRKSLRKHMLKMHGITLEKGKAGL